MIDNLIDVLETRLISLNEACELLASRPHVSTLWRWATKGVKGVKLQTVILGGRRFTTAEFLAQFVARLTNPSESDGIPPSRDVQQRQAVAADRTAAIFDKPAGAGTSRSQDRKDTRLQQVSRPEKN